MSKGVLLLEYFTVLLSSQRYGSAGDFSGFRVGLGGLWFCCVFWVLVALYFSRVPHGATP